MTGPTPPFADTAVERAFAALPSEAGSALLVVRQMVFETAAATDGVGPLTETLKWGQPAYLTEATGAGTTIRLATAKDGRPAVFVHCQTDVIAGTAEVFPDECDYKGTRAARFDPSDLPEAALRYLIASALTYHMTRRR